MTVRPPAREEGPAGAGHRRRRRHPPGGRVEALDLDRAAGGHVGEHAAEARDLAGERARVGGEAGPGGRGLGARRRGADEHAAQSGADQQRGRQAGGSSWSSFSGLRGELTGSRRTSGATGPGPRFAPADPGDRIRQWFPRPPCARHTEVRQTRGAYPTGAGGNGRAHTRGPGAGTRLARSDSRGACYGRGRREIAERTAWPQKRRADLRDLSGGLHGGRHDGERVRAVAVRRRLGRVAGRRHGGLAARSPPRRRGRRPRGRPGLRRRGRPGSRACSRPSPRRGGLRLRARRGRLRRPPPSTRRRLRRRRGARRRSRARAAGRGRGRRRRPVPAGRAWRCAARGGCAEGSSGRRGRFRWLRCRSEAWPDCAPTPPVPRRARRNIGVPARFQPRIRWLQWRARGAYAAPNRCHIMRGLRLSVTVGWRTCRNGSAVPHLDRTKPGRTRPGGPNGRTCQ